MDAITLRQMDSLEVTVALDCLHSRRDTQQSTATGAKVVGFPARMF